MSKTLYGSGWCLQSDERKIGQKRLKLIYPGISFNCGSKDGITRFCTD